MIDGVYRTRTASLLAFAVSQLVLTLKAGPTTTETAARLVEQEQSPAARGIRVGANPNVRAAQITSEALASRTDRLVAQVMRGTITPADFERKMAALLARAYTQQYMQGAGVRELTAAQREQIAKRVAVQLEFLREFRASMGERIATLRTPEELAKDLAAFQRRARMYADGTQVAWWMGRTDGLDLPAFPKDGGTACLSNCGCFWEIEEVDSKRGYYDCYWRLGDKEHCEDCMSREKNYSPYKVRPKGKK